MSRDEQEANLTKIIKAGVKKEMVCRICGEELSEKNYVMMLVCEGRKDSYSLCEECFGDLDNWVEGFLRFESPPAFYEY